MNRALGRLAVMTSGASVPIVSVVLFNPNVPGHYPTCPVRALLGVDCPGCGSLRALYDLAHGDIVGALDRNALLLLFLPLFVVEAVRWVLGRPPTPLLGRRYTPLAVLVLVTGWTLVRNIPVAPFDVLASTAA